MTHAFPTVLLLIGVSGVGKTTVGQAVADRLGWEFFDADDLHSPENVAKIAAGEGLTDADRAPWLEAVRRLIERRLDEDRPAVIACSALKASYRAKLRGRDDRVGVVWLDAPQDVLAARLASRRGHFAGVDLLPSQLDALEPATPDEARRVEATGAVRETAQRVIAALGTGLH